MFHLRLDQALFFYKIVPFSYFYNPFSVMGQWGSVLMCHIDRGGVRGGWGSAEPLANESRPGGMQARHWFQPGRSAR